MVKSRALRRLFWESAAISNKGGEFECEDRGSFETQLRRRRLQSPTRLNPLIFLVAFFFSFPLSSHSAFLLLGVLFWNFFCGWGASNSNGLRPSAGPAIYKRGPEPANGKRPAGASANLILQAARKTEQATQIPKPPPRDIKTETQGDEI